MELYDSVARQTARSLTLRYSTSFGLASRLFASGIRDDIYAIYGLVRIADEVVDTYGGADAGHMLDALEAETYAAMERNYSTDLIVHAFARTARQYGIGRELVAPFFASMRADLQPVAFGRQQYDTYIYGSAEVVGLMCLRVFCTGEDEQYTTLESGARALGAAYQKVNFLRDLAYDRGRLGRNYFPQLQDHELDESVKQEIISEIEADFTVARGYIDRLPSNARRAVQASYTYYSELLERLRLTPADVIYRQRIRVPDSRKLLLFAKTAVRRT